MKKKLLFLWILFISFFSFSQQYNFTGDRNVDGVLLTWNKTHNECDYYIVKRSVDGFPSEQIVKVDENLENKEYDFLDKLFLTHQGVISYELLAMKNGQEISRSVFFIENIYERNVNISPNPTERGLVTVAISGIEKEQGIIDVYTPMGEVLYSTGFEFSSNQEVQTIDTRNFTHREKLYLRVRTVYNTKVIRLFF